MNLRINFSSGVPIYLQLMEQIKHAVETGAIRAGEQLPTIRSVAEELTMNPNTVARAYRELEREGDRRGAARIWGLCGGAADRPPRRRLRFASGRSSAHCDGEGHGAWSVGIGTAPGL